MSATLNLITKRELPSHLPVLSYHERYQPFNYLGNGSFGSVLLTRYKGDVIKNLIKSDSSKIGTLMYPLSDCQAKHSSLVAIKTMTKKLPNLSDYSKVKELKFILSVSSHPCLVQIYEVFIDDIKHQLHIAMEPMNQNLHQLMRARKNIHFSSVTLRSILSQILCGIRHIHKHNYFHRDVKPENILIVPTNQYYGDSINVPPWRRDDNYVVKLADYGLARHIHNLKPFTDYVSTRWYRSPEILLKNSWYSKPVDIWAFGVVCTEIINFHPLFPGSDEVDQLNRILQTLGCPVAHDIESEVPLGGFWHDAEALSLRLGFQFPKEKGLTLNDIFHTNINSDLLNLIKGCLTWNPNIRLSIDKCCESPYFNNTIITEEEVNYPNSFKSIQQSLQLLAGISSSTYNSMNTVSSPITTTAETESGIFDDEIDDGYHYIYESKIKNFRRDNFDHPFDCKPDDTLLNSSEKGDEDSEVQEDKDEDKENQQVIDPCIDLENHLWNSTGVNEKSIPRVPQGHLSRLTQQGLSTYKSVFRYN